MTPLRATAEHRRLEETRDGTARWRLWGPYLPERQWGTVREDYSADGNAWDYFPHDHARSRAYRWGEDGLLGICDEGGRLCFGLALWNEADPFLKERLFGLTNPQGNHGEDVKEQYFYLDNTPSHAYMKALYRYPQRAFPYEDLIAESRRRTREEREYELLDTGVFEGNRFFDVMVEYAKAADDDLIIRITATNHGADPAPLHILPTLWFRNTWSWAPGAAKPELSEVTASEGVRLVRARHADLGEYWLAWEGAAQLLFTENETNNERLWNLPNASTRVKDAIHDAVVTRDEGPVSGVTSGTKAAVHHRLVIAPGASETVLLRLSAARQAHPFADARAILERRSDEAEAFYASIAPDDMAEDARSVQRQAFAGLLWGKKFFHYDVDRWLRGDSASAPPPAARLGARNAAWRHLNNADIISMPDSWEFPWYAAWDLAFHCVPLAVVDAEFAKEQLILMLREWYMHPNGQLPAYEWNFSDVNAPVHAWAVWRVYKIDAKQRGIADRAFLERAFHKLLLNFTWWVNRKDSEGMNVFQGGFLGLDNIGVFDRSTPLQNGHLEQSDGTAFMGMFSLNMLTIALELARHNRAYEDIATKFFEHFMYIAGALNNIGGDGIALWDEDDAFFYDVLHFPDGASERLKVRSLVGLIPLLAVETIEPDVLDALPDFRRRLEWFLEHRPELASLVSHWQVEGEHQRRMLALVRGHRMKRLLARMLDPEEFLSDHGVRSVSRYHLDHPYSIEHEGMRHEVRYEPGESSSGLFGGNSNWRGPIWFPINFLLIESLQKFDHYYGDDFLVEHPTGSGQKRTLSQIADDLSRRLTHMFLRDESGRRHVFGANELQQSDPLWRDLVPFHEYYHGDTGAGLGARYQGWSMTVAKLL